MTEPDDPGYLRMYSDVAQIEGVLAETRGLGEELAKLADSIGGNHKSLKTTSELSETRWSPQSSAPSTTCGICSRTINNSLLSTRMKHT